MEKHSLEKAQEEANIMKQNIPNNEKGKDNIKKIDISGFSEVEYAEKVINFPKHIIKETGGVEGYIRKTVSWDELLKFWDISADDWGKMEKGHNLFSREDAEEENKINKNMGGNGIYKEERLKELPSKKSIENFKQANGIELIIKELTNNEFISQTLNHVTHRGGPISDKILGKDKMLEEIKITNYERVYDIKTNKLLFAEEDEEKEEIKNKVKENNSTYSQSNFGFNLTNPEKFWRGYNFQGYYDADSPSIKHIVLGFKINTHNAALREYCEKIIKLLDVQEKLKKENYISQDESIHDIQARKTVEALLAPLKEEIIETTFSPNASNKLKATAKYNVISGHQDQAEHPRIPIIKNHPEIKDLRLCHADYALIPTKNGINILKMIATQDNEEKTHETSDDEILLMEKQKELKVLKAEYTALEKKKHEEYETLRDEQKIMQEKFNTKKYVDLNDKFKRPSDEMRNKIQEIKQEIEKMLPIMLIYRENDLFDKHIPEIKQTLSNMGYEVDIHNFSKETEEILDEEIKKWYEEHQKDFKNIQIISDYTAQVPCDMEDDLESHGVIIKTGFANKLLGEISSRAELGNDKYEELYSKKDWSDEKSQILLTRVTEKILENPKNEPEKVYIFLDAILDHAYNGDKEVLDNKTMKDIMYFKAEKSDNAKKIFKELGKLEAEKVRRCLVEAGIGEDKIIISETNLNPAQESQDIFKEADKTNNWIIIDRHASQYKEIHGDFKNAIRLNLPAGNFYGDAEKNKLIPEVKSEDFSAAIKATLEKRFDKKNKNN